MLRETSFGVLNLQLFVPEKFHPHFESFVWGHHDGFLLRDINMVTGKLKELCLIEACKMTH